jgi:hypothetical protein
MIVNPPSPTASTTRWQTFLAEMTHLLEAEPDNAGAKKAVGEARAELERRYRDSLFGSAWSERNK